MTTFPFRAQLTTGGGCKSKICRKFAKVHFFFFKRNSRLGGGVLIETNRYFPIPVQRLTPPLDKLFLARAFFNTFHFFDTKY